MIAANHLWQSTWFALAAALLTLAFRRNKAQVRYWLWFSASVKFLAPFSILLAFGAHVPLRVARPEIVNAAPAAVQAMEPFPEPETPIVPTRHATSVIRLGAGVLWVCGMLAAGWLRMREWLQIRAALRASRFVGMRSGVPMRMAPGLLEPGVTGLFRPVLLIPEGIANALSPAQLEAVLRHELCHVRRRDNLTAAIHMIVEGVFWFHPLVWWIGAHLIEERERACDEAVIAMGSKPGEYAEAILGVCRLYAESPLRCVAGITSSDIKRRVERILSAAAAVELRLVRKVLLMTAAGVAAGVPIAIGVLQAQASASAPKFEVASIRPCSEGVARGGERGQRKGGAGGGVRSDAGRLHLGCETVERLIQFAYLAYPEGKPWNKAGLPGLPEPPVPFTRMFEPIRGAPAWVRSERFTIDAKPERAERVEMMRGPMMQRLLEERFRLKVERETREAPVYVLTVATGGPRLTRARGGNCNVVNFDPAAPPGPRNANLPGCGFFGPNGDGGIRTLGQTIAGLCVQMSAWLDREVVDRTEIAGTYDIALEINAADFMRGPRDAAEEAPMDKFGEIAGALQKLGLKLEAGKVREEFLVIDHIERPSAN